MRSPGRHLPVLPALPVLMALLAAGGLLAWPIGAQSPDASALSPADSAAILSDVRERQIAFERFRESRIPPETTARGGGCDERIGRICIWFGGADEANFPREPVETGLARRELIGELNQAALQIRDPWIMGQLVHYLVEDGRTGEAERVARGCDLEAAWWCSALVGYVLHMVGDFVEAEAAFRGAVAQVPPEEVERWRTPRFLVSSNARSAFDRLDDEARAHQLELFWRLSDPLFLLDGNDRLTDHYARLVVAINREDAENPYGLPWEEDLEESLVRYGRTTGWSRIRSPAGGGIGGGGLGGGLQLQDSRRIVGHHHPGSRGYLFPEAFLEAPGDIPPESWITAPREARDWYAPPYAPDFRGLETQVARFRRDDEMLVVAAYRPTPDVRDPLSAVAPPPVVEEARDPFGGGFGRANEPEPPPGELLWGDAPQPDLGPVQSGFFLVPESGEDALSILGTESEGVLVMHAPPGRYVSSMEVLAPRDRRAWRARQGVSQEPLTRGLADVSDLILLREGAPLPDDLDAAIPLARPGVRVRQGERFAVGWEVYGLGVEEELQVTLGFTQGRPGFLTRVGEFLGILEPDSPVEITFADTGPDEVATLFRAVELSLPDLTPGDYTLHLRLDLPGREPAIASRPITVEP